MYRIRKKMYTFVYTYMCVRVSMDRIHRMLEYTYIASGNLTLEQR